jgi:hypothetical protein
MPFAEKGNFSAEVLAVFSATAWNVIEISHNIYLINLLKIIISDISFLRAASRVHLCYCDPVAVA